VDASPLAAKCRRNRLCLFSRGRLFSAFGFRHPTLRLPPGDSLALEVCFASFALYSNAVLLAHALLL